MDQSVQSKNAQPVIPPHTPSSTNSLLTIIVVAIISAILASLATYMVMSLQQNKQSQMSILPTPQQTSPTQTAIPTSTEQSVATNYVKRQFDVNKKFFQTKEYPKEVVSISENNLIGMKCTPRLTCVSPYDSCIYYPEEADTNKPPTKLTDPNLLTAIKEANKTIDKQTVMGTPAGDVYEVTSCKTEDNRQILRYKTGGTGGGAGSVDYIGIVSSDNTVKRIASVQKNTAYFGCDQPLQLTKNNILYYQCLGGDGPSGSSSIYSIDLAASTKKAILQCASTGDEAGKVTLTCK